MTAVPAECESKAQRPGGVRPRRLLIATFVVAAISVIAIAGFRVYGSGSADHKFKAALAAVDRGDFELARRYARELKASQPASPRAKFLRGALLLERGFCFPALDELGKAKEEAGLETAALTLMGEAWYRLGRHVEAQAALKQVLKEEPNSVEAHRWLAASYYDLGVISNAVIHLQRTAELDPADPRPHRLLGLMHKDFERYEDAIPFYEESLRRKGDQPDDAEIRLELAICQARTRRYRDALATLAKSDELPDVNVLRAECYHALGQTDASKAALARALEVDGNNLDGLLLQGTLFLEEGDARAAIKALGLAIQRYPKDYAAHYRLAQAYGKAGEQELSTAEQEAAEKIRVIRHEFAQLHKAAWEYPDNIPVRLRLASLAQQLGRPDLTEVWLRAAAALQPVADSESK